MVKLARTGDARIVRLSESEYHADPCETPSLSASVAHTLVSRSPAHAYLQHPKLGGKPRSSTKQMDRGARLHKMLLGEGRDIVAVDADDWRSKAAREARDELRAKGAIPVLLHELELEVEIAKRLQERLAIEFNTVLDGESELSVFWQETATDGTAIPCRGMLDHWKRDAATIFDLKMCRSAHPRACQSHMIGYGHDIQCTAYTRALGRVFPELLGRVDFVTLFCEMEEPYLITPARRAGSMMELGEARWLRAVNLWSECLRSGKFPGYTQEIIAIEAPNWALSAELESENWESPFAPDGPVSQGARPTNGDSGYDIAEYDAIF